MYVVDLPIAENQRLGLSSDQRERIETSQFEAAKHMTSGRSTAPAGLANPAEINQNIFNRALRVVMFRNEVSE